jgi:hypothetical protein
VGANGLLNGQQFSDRNVETRQEPGLEGLPIAQQPLSVGGPDVKLTIFMVNQRRS